MPDSAESSRFSWENDGKHSLDAIFLAKPIIIFDIHRSVSGKAIIATGQSFFRHFHSSPTSVPGWDP
ncbi:MAG: hypothetical protein LBM23_06585 [Propionibacteriaceae bacterium]|jgi:hypothetical protein|nr:hypothetical protein [Propionibacteriaceae bacterium]